MAGGAASVGAEAGMRRGSAEELWDSGRVLVSFEAVAKTPLHISLTLESPAHGTPTPCPSVDRHRRLVLPMRHRILHVPNISRQSAKGQREKCERSLALSQAWQWMLGGPVGLTWRRCMYEVVRGEAQDRLTADLVREC